MEDLHPAVVLLLKRIETNPDEFEKWPVSQWSFVVRKFERYFTDAEFERVSAALSSVQKDVMHKQIISEMLNPTAKMIEGGSAALNAAAKQLSGQLSSQLSTNIGTTNIGALGHTFVPATYTPQAAQAAQDVQGARTLFSAFSRRSLLA